MSALAEVRAEIGAACARSGRSVDDIRLVAVSKTFSFAAVEALYQEGQRDFGENYVQELVEKADLAVARGMTDLRWHFIGHLQSNKLKTLAAVPGLAWIHSVDSVSLLEKIFRLDTRPGLLLQVDLDAEATKSGFAPGEVVDVLAAHPQVKGLMCIPSPRRLASEDSSRAAFRELRELAWAAGRRELSMGMSQDFGLAVEEGATFVRVGTRLFGKR